MNGINIFKQFSIHIRVREQCEINTKRSDTTNDRKKRECNHSVAKCCKYEYQVNWISCSERFSGYPLHEWLSFDIPFLVCLYLFYQICFFTNTDRCNNAFWKAHGKQKGLRHSLFFFFLITFSIRICPSFQKFRNNSV